MSCSSCTTNINTPKGCKNNGVCGTDGCNKLSVFDWLSNLQLPGGQDQFDCVEVRFKKQPKRVFQKHRKVIFANG